MFCILAGQGAESETRMNIDGYGWTPADYQQLQNLARSGKQMAEIVRQMRRAEQSVTAAAKRASVVIVSANARPVAPVSSEQARFRLQALAKAKGSSLTALSRMIGRRDGFLGTFVRDGVPRTLAGKDRDLLANFFRVDPADFGSSRPG